jgi:SWI/SNF-related matrix-associated actin-dependent regulator of chromatin subfamily A-like protein 1
MTTDEIQTKLRALNWSKPVEVETRRGARLLQKAEPTAEFYYLWTHYRSELKDAGITIGKKYLTRETIITGTMDEVCWWQELPAEEVARRESNAAMSSAVHADLNIPCPVGKRYMGFQLAGVQFALANANCLIADEMGLGKTIQAIGLINAEPRIQRVLIIVKAGLKRNWQRELHVWLTRPMTIGVAEGGCFPSADIVLVNFELLHKFPRSLSFYWDLIVVDEAHYLKNRKARRTKAVVGYKPTRKEAEKGVLASAPLNARRKLLLTGTAMENETEELWTLLYFLDQQTFSNQWSFCVKYCGMVPGKYGLRPGGEDKTQVLHRMLRERYMIRRLKSQVLTELPAKTRVLVEMDCPEAAHALAAEHAFMRTMKEAAPELDGENGDDFEAALSHLNDGERMIAFQEMARLRHTTALAKVAKGIEMLREELDEVRKVIVFAHHSDVLEQLHAAFPGESVLVNGEVADLDEREARIQQFQQDPACRLFFGSIRACGEGITLTAASLVVFFEEDWVPGKMSQCEDRAHRIGQRDNVLVKHYLVNGSLDVKIARTHVEKQKLIDAVLDGKARTKT